MKFAAMGWLWALLILPLLYFYVLYNENKKRERLHQFMHRGLWSKLIPEIDLLAPIRKLRLWIVGVTLVIIALARPQFGSHEEVIQVANLDIMIALDVSRSMDVEDVIPSRIKKAKHWIRTFIEKSEGDRIGIVSFAGNADLDSPLTTDTDYVMNRVTGLHPYLAHNQGTDIGAGLDAALRALERGTQNEELPQEEESQVLSSAIILISDGEDHEGNAARVLSNAGRLSKRGIRFYVIGVGTEKGGPIPVRDENGNAIGFKRDRNGKTVISTFHPDSLAKLANESGGRYWNMTNSEGEVFEILSELGTLNRTERAEKRFVVFEDRFQIPLALALICLLIELSLPVRRPMNRIKMFCFWMAAACLLNSPFNASRLYAEPSATSPEKVLPENIPVKSKIATPLDIYLQNQKGMKAFQEGNMDEAQKDFGEAQARDPNRPELEFNQGVVQSQKGDLDRAIQAFDSAARLSKSQNDTKLLGRSLYNLGVAQTKKGEYKSAIENYLNAIQAAQDAHDGPLEAVSRKNLQLLLDQMKQQQQKQQQDQQQNQQNQQQSDKDQQKQQQSPQDQKSKEDQKKDPKEGKDQKQNQQQNDHKGSQSDKDQSSNQNQNGSESNNENDSQKNSQSDSQRDQKSGGDQERQNERARGGKKQKFDSQRMTGEDAERVFSELKTKERELQERLQKQNAKIQTHSKDW